MKKAKTKTTKKATKHNPKSEAAQEKAILNRGALLWDMKVSADGKTVLVTAKMALPPYELFAVFDLRDCYKKRKPLKGIGKAMVKLVRTRK